VRTSAIIVEPLGGLGNQLFTYATGLSLAMKLGVPLDVDTQGFQDYVWHEYELDSFDNSIARTFQGRPRKVPGERVVLNRFLDPIRYKAGSRLFIERQSTFDPRVLELREGSRLRGYFQSPRYFSEHSSLIRDETTQVHNPSEWFRETSEELSALGSWLGVHIRRGNYTVIPGMGLAPQSYYSAAIDLVDKCVGQLPIVVFSDDPSAAHEILGRELLHRVRLLQPPIQSRPIESMNLLRQASHLVIANSTFGWWAAWLGDHEGRMTVYPRPWLDSSWHNERDLIPEGWVSLSR